MTPSGYFLTYLWLIPLFPLLTATLTFFFGRHLPKLIISFCGTASVALSFIFALGAVFQLLALDPSQRFYQQVYFEWLNPGAVPAAVGFSSFTADWGYLFDPLSCVMVLVITGIGLLVHIYSIGFMRGEAGNYRYFGYLHLSLFFMLSLVLANNLLLLFVGWEGVSLCSYLLVGFYFLKRSSTNAAIRTFLFNRIGDAGFLLGIFLITTTFGTLRFTSQGLTDPIATPGIVQTLSTLLNQHSLALGAPVLTAIALLLFAGAIGKSAQIPLSVWLPDAAEAPMPVGALMHSATMVTAGVYLIARMNSLYQLAPVAMEIIAIVGALTAIYAATVALVHTDIKRILAYSTISQLGFMFLALGVGAFSAGIFQLLTHALFKALLFLSAGSLVLSLSGEQDIRKMGGMWNAIPATSRPFLIATLAIAAIPPFAGFFSENEILGDAYHGSHFMNPHIFLWLGGIIIAALTAIYSFRLLFLAFLGRSRVSPQLEVQIHESPQTMAVPLTILAFLSIIGGWFALPVLWGEPNSLLQFLAPVLGEVQTATTAVAPGIHVLLKEYLLLSTPLLAASLGIWLAYRIYLQKPKLRDKIPAAWPRLHRLLVHQYYFDQFYTAVFVNPVKDLSLALDFADAILIDGLATNGTVLLARSLSRVSAWCDKWILGLLINFIAKFVQTFSNPIRLLQTGVFSSYGVWMLLGLTLLLGYYAHHMQVWMRTLH